MNAVEKPVTEKPARGDLILAISRMDVAAVTALLERGADPNDTNYAGETGLMYVMVLGYTAKKAQDLLVIADLLVKWGTDLQQKSDKGYNTVETVQRYRSGWGMWPDAAALRQFEAILKEAPERHQRFLEERKALAKAQQDEKIREMQDRLNSKSAVKIKPGRQKTPAGP